ncbi:efflux RND transporter periplasmic adaptor subunit [Fibrobacter sp.]|uniref:efflux RND transporter periplasmic adaptor subunit n=1 Tax=Fibrobacter sp. TaxID=35828 RepID=UPI0038668286
MNKTVKTLLTIAVASLMLVACDKKEENAEKKATTIEEIQKEKGKPARVVKASTAKLTDVRKFSGTIQGINQNSAICKMGDPIAKINVQVGSTVQKDQVIAEYLYTGDNTQYQEAQEKIAVLEKATERMRELHAKGGVSQQDMDSQEMQLKVAKMGLETARRATLILAPEAGVVTEIKFKVGQTPGQGAQFATIAKLNKVILKLNVTSKDIGFFKKGANATVKVADETFTGKVSLIPLAADPTTHFFPVEITFDNKAKKLLPGMYVTAELDARQVEGIVVPAEAIVYRNGINIIWTVTPEGKALRKIVKIGVQTKNDIQVLEGLEGNETIIVEGQSKMNDGDKVLVVE